MAQTKKAYEEAKIPFQKMTFSPDVPSSALGPNEYNAGLNVETDVRGIRSVAGDEFYTELANILEKIKNETITDPRGKPSLRVRWN